MLKSPIFIVGPPRSGTTWLSHAFEQTDEVAMIREPRQIWEWGHWFRPDDHLVEADATPLIKQHIRKRFEKLTQREKKTRFCDKTPSNSLRTRFIQSIFPDGRFIFIYRDGRAVIRSTSEIKRVNMTWKNMWKRTCMRISQSSPTDLIGLFSRINILTSKITGQPIKNWGAHPPGWREWQHLENQSIVLARQWAVTAKFALDDLRQIPEEQVLKVSYEKMIHEPRLQMKRIVQFAGLKNPDPLLQYAEETADPSRLEKWKKELDEATLESIRPELEPVMQQLEIPW